MGIQTHFTSTMWTTAQISDTACVLSLEANLQPSQVVLSFCSRFKYFTTPALSKLMSTIQGQISSQLEPRHFQINLKGSGRYLSCWWYLPPSSPFRLRCTAGGEGAGLIWACVQKAVLSTTSAGRDHRATPWSLSINWSVSQWQCRLSVRKKTIHCCAIKKWAHWHTYLYVWTFIHFCVFVGRHAALDAVCVNI